MPIRWHDRVFVTGQSSSGKSELLNLLFTDVVPQKILLDTKGEFAIEDEKGRAIRPTRRTKDIDWEQRVIHFQELSGNLDEYDELSWEVMQRRNIVVCCHEMADLCDDQPNRTPKWVRQHIRKGNVFGNGWLAGSQRPVGMPRQARTEAQHVFHMVPSLDLEDHKIVAPMMRVSDFDLHRHLDEAAALAATGEYSFVWFDRRNRRAGASGLSLWPPLPEDRRRAIIVRRTADV